MGEITDIDVTGEVRRKSSSTLGDAHQHLATGILMRLGFDVSISGVTSGSYDLLINAYTQRIKKPQEHIRAQVKTCTGGSLRLIGGVRAGVD